MSVLNLYICTKLYMRNFSNSLKKKKTNQNFDIKQNFDTTDLEKLIFCFIQISRPVLNTNFPECFLSGVVERNL